ncbi:MAG: class I tRNA ligase family protein, partial [Bacteroidales bacterium]|nr:class I tRNA ligase family protein [Bacteroidales bacterium]
RKYRLSEALMQLYRLTWDDFCSWYLEMIKPAYGQAVDPVTLRKSMGFMETLMQALHPFMPFITEEIWQVLGERKEGETVMFQPLPEKTLTPEQENLLAHFEQASEIIMSVRALRNEKNIPQKNALALKIKAGADKKGLFDGLIAKLCNLESVEYVSASVDGAFTFMAANTEFFVPMAGLVNVEDERARAEKDLKYEQGFLLSVRKKLENKRFVDNAPQAVVDAERKKMADCEQRIALLEAQLKQLK